MFASDHCRSLHISLSQKDGTVSIVIEVFMCLMASFQRLNRKPMPMLSWLSHIIW